MVLAVDRWNDFDEIARNQINGRMNEAAEWIFQHFVLRCVVIANRFALVAPLWLGTRCKRQAISSLACLVCDEDEI